MLQLGGKKTFLMLIRMIAPQALGLVEFTFLFLELLHFSVPLSTKLSAMIAIFDFRILEEMLHISSVAAYAMTCCKLRSSIYQKGRTISYHIFLLTYKALKEVLKSQILKNSKIKNIFVRRTNYNIDIFKTKANLSVIH